MAKEKETNKNKLYECKDCHFLYKTKELADRCGYWCIEKGVCNTEIKKQAVGVSSEQEES